MNFKIWKVMPVSLFVCQSSCLLARPPAHLPAHLPAYLPAYLSAQFVQETTQQIAM
jgi:hypothetical protein